MDAITNLMQNFKKKFPKKISKDSFWGKDLTTEKDCLQKVELSFKEQNFEQKIEFLYYVGKCCMCLSFQAEYFLSREDVLKLVVLTEEHFASEKKLRELGWCANYMKDYMMDKITISWLILLS